METCQVSLNLDQLTVWYMKGWLAIKPDQKTIFFVQINFSLLLDFSFCYI